MKSTSIDAYEAVKPHIRAMHEKVLNAIDEQGATASEISVRTGLFLKTATNRLCELKGFGLVKDTKITRLNPRNRHETVVVRT